jgi:hypothetical protein
MKKTAIPLFIFSMMMFTTLVSVKASAQRPDFIFEKSYPFEWKFGGTHSLEICDVQGETECYFISACDLSTIGYLIGAKGITQQKDVDQPATVLKLSPEGDLLGELAMNEDGRPSSIIRLFQDPSDSKYCLAIGTVLDSTMHYLNPYLARFDHALNMAWYKEIELPEEYCAILLGGRSIMDSCGDIVFCSLPLGEGFSSNMLYIRLSCDGELLALGSSPLSSEFVYSAQGDLFEYQDGSGDYGQSFVGDYDGFGEIPVFFVRMNRELTDFQTRDLANNITMDSTDGILIGHRYAESFAVSLHDGTKYLSTRGERWDGWNIDLWDDVIVSMKLDQNDSIVAFSFIPHDNDSIRTMAFCHGMDMSNEESFFVCNGVYDRRGWQNGEIEGLNRFAVSKTDSDVNIIWTRYYEDGQHVFQPCSVMATSDGGCLVTGRYWTSDHTQSMLFAIKILHDGSLSIPAGEASIRPYMFYPNPAQDQLHLQYSPDVQPAHIELIDLQGRLVRTQGKAFETFDLGMLPAGTYTLRVTMEDGQVFADKVVKE